MKQFLYVLIILLSSSSIWAQVTITQSGGWLESAFVEWQAVSGATSYNVYYNGNGAPNQKIDEQLIRSYGTYLRADVLGLKAGSYTIKVAPVIAGVEGTASSTSSLTVLPHDRAGFAFSGGRVPGAYQADGTPKNGAVILYITKNTVNTVSLNVTGASTNPCVGLKQILDGYKKGKDSRPLIIRLIGQIKDPAELDKGDIVMENNLSSSVHITLEGVGEDATVDGWGIRLKNATNVEIRNLGIMNVNSSEGDNIGLQQNNDHIWVHNNDFFYGDAGSDADQVKGDGALDCKKSTFVTFSYNHFFDSGKSNLLGLSEDPSKDWYITYHHNWYDHSDSRHPRVRFYSAHVYNNYYDGNAKYGVGSTMGSSVFVENNYFRHCKYPMLISLQGSDISGGGGGTFSGEAGGIIKAYGNYMEGQKSYVPYSQNNVEFDAYDAASRSATVPSSVSSKNGSNHYNNFDIDASLMYSYSVDSPSDAKTKVETYAGRLHGGDFKWDFVDATADASYAVDQSLKNALVAYTTDLVAVQGEGSVVIISSSSVSSSSIISSSSTISSSSVVLSSSSNAISSSSSSSSISISSSSSLSSSSAEASISENWVHNFTVSGTESSVFSISGNLSTSKGTEIYGGLTLTQCLKMESATQISFTTSSQGALTLVFNATFTGEIKVDNVAHTASAGIVKISLEPGSHVISKGNTSNLYYMNLEFSQPSSSGNISSNQSSSNLSSSSQLTVGINRINSKKQVLHMNIGTRQLYLSENTDVAVVEIFSLLGTRLQKENLYEGYMSLQDLNAGVYWVRVTSDQGILNQKISLTE